MNIQQPGQFPFDTGRFYLTKEKYVLFEVIEIYVHPYENIVTKPTRGRASC